MSRREPDSTGPFLHAAEAVFVGPVAQPTSDGMPRSYGRRRRPAEGRGRRARPSARR